PSETGRAGGHDLARAVEIDRDHLAGAPVREPQPLVVPPQRLHVGQAGGQDARWDGVGHPGGGTLRMTSIATSSLGWSRPIILPMTAPHTTSGGAAVTTAPRRRIRAIRSWSRRSTSPSVQKADTAPSG